MNSHEAAFPRPASEDRFNDENIPSQSGLTKREYFAIQAMKPLLAAMYGTLFNKGVNSNSGIGKTSSKDAAELRHLIVEAACTFADELIVELSKEKSK